MHIYGSLNASIFCQLAKINGTIEHPKLLIDLLAGIGKLQFFLFGILFCYIGLFAHTVLLSGNGTGVYFVMHTNDVFFFASPD